MNNYKRFMIAVLYCFLALGLIGCPCEGDFIVTDAVETLLQDILALYPGYTQKSLLEISQCDGGVITGNLAIHGSYATSFIGSESLTQVTENLVIKSNANLTRLAGLENLTSVGGDLEISNNTALPTSCEAEWLRDNIGNIGGEVTIDDNLDDGGENECPIHAADREWTWIDVPNAKCANGSPTGIGVNLSSTSTDVVIYLRGGGACWNEETCFPTDPEETEWAMYLTGYGSTELSEESDKNSGIFNRNFAHNPVKEWNYVFVPYCTGDLHAGIQEGVYDSGTIHHVGYNNMSEYLKRLVPTFKDAGRILLTGSSAGGYGSVYNFDQVQNAFENVRVDQISDSGPFITEACWNSGTPGLQATMRGAWGLLDENYPYPVDCSNCRTGSMLDLRRFLLTEYQFQRFGLICSSMDITLRRYFGVTPPLREIRGLTPEGALMLPETLLEGMHVLVDETLGSLPPEEDPYPNWQAFIQQGINHVWWLPNFLNPYNPGEDINAWLQLMLDDSVQWQTITPPESGIYW